MFSTLNGKVAANIRIGLTLTCLAWVTWTGTPAFSSDVAVVEGQGSNQHEVLTISTDSGGLFSGWQNEDMTVPLDPSLPSYMQGFTNRRYCQYGISDDTGTQWKVIQEYKFERFPWSGNPTIAEAEGRLFAVCMSAEAPTLARGILVLSYSDDHGKTWSNWNEVVSSSNGSPDKPWLVALSRTKLAVIYSDFVIAGYFRAPDGHGGYIQVPYLEGQVRMLLSDDAGKTWSNQVNLSIPRVLRPAPTNPDPSKASDAGDYGPFLIKGLNQNTLLASWGADGGNGIFFALYDTARGVLSTKKAVSESYLSAPITKIAVGPHKGELSILWYEAHSISKVFASFSSDAGSTWTAPFQISEHGSLADGEFDAAGAFNVIWNEFDQHEGGSTSGLKLAKLKLNPYPTVEASRYLAGPFANQPPGGMTRAPYLADGQGWIGAYQALLRLQNGTWLAHYLEWRNGDSKLRAATFVP